MPTYATAKVIALPNGDERKLRAAWSKVDRLKAEMRLAEQEARRLERVVGRNRGYVFPPSREALEREMGR